MQLVTTLALYCACSLSPALTTTLDLMSTPCNSVSGKCRWLLDHDTGVLDHLFEVSET